MIKEKSHLLVRRTTKRMKNINEVMEPVHTKKDLEIENQKFDDEIKWLNNEIESYRNNQEEYDKNALQLKKCMMME